MRGLKTRRFVMENLLGKVAVDMLDVPVCRQVHVCGWVCVSRCVRAQRYVFM